MQVDFERGRWAPNTRESYANCWADFEKFKPVESLPVPVQDIADFLYARAETHSTAALSVRKSAIIAVHQMHGFEVPVKSSVIKDAWAEICRRKGTRNIPKDALTLDDIRQIVDAMPGHLLQARAAILFTFATCMRRSEVVAVNLDDLEIDEEGMTVTIRRSKTDKAGKGEQVAVLRSGTNYCAVRALEAWMGYAQIQEGAVFRCNGRRTDARTIADWYKRWAANVGHDPKRIGAHSGRRGGVTTMIKAGIDPKNVATHSRHKSMDMVFRYVQEEKARANPAIAALRL